MQNIIQAYDVPSCLHLFKLYKLKKDGFKYFLLVDVSSDFIRKKKAIYFSYSLVMYSKIPKFCSVIHETIFHSISTYEVW